MKEHHQRIALWLLALLWLGTGQAFAGADSWFVYHPRRYPPGTVERLPAEITPLVYRTQSGNQVVFYAAADSNSRSVPKRFWVLFGGNGSVALDWLELSGNSLPDKDAGYLLVDYPGYGACAGKPDYGGIRESSEAALAAVAQHLQVPVSRIEGNLNVMGHSLGAAVALEFAVLHPVREVILLAPFTSMKAMANQFAGPVGALLVSQPFDNVERLRELGSRPKTPRVTIIHGTDDHVIPVTMGRALALSQPGITKYVEVAGDHNSILWSERSRVAAIMKSQPENGGRNIAH